MTEQVLSETSRRYLETSATLTRLCIERKALINDSLPRFGLADPEDIATNRKQFAEINAKISTAEINLKHLEDESLECVGVKALLGEGDYPMCISNAVAILTTSSIRREFADELDSVYELIQLAAGNDMADSVVLKESFASGGLLRKHVYLKAAPLVQEQRFPALCEQAYRQVLGLQTPRYAVEPVRAGR